MEFDYQPTFKRPKTDLEKSINWMDMPLDFWSNHVFPFVGSQQYRFVGGVCGTF
jgi:hypothetical protein